MGGVGVGTVFCMDPVEMALRAGLTPLNSESFYWWDAEGTVKVFLEVDGSVWRAGVVVRDAERVRERLGFSPEAAYRDRSFGSFRSGLESVKGLLPRLV